jgi:hypothetical protein
MGVGDTTFAMAPVRQGFTHLAVLLFGGGLATQHPGVLVVPARIGTAKATTAKARVSNLFMVVSPYFPR